MLINNCYDGGKCMEKKEELKFGFNVDPMAEKYYRNNYDIIFEKKFDAKEDCYLGDETHKVCRFCHKDESQVTFKNRPHVISEQIGNRHVLSYYECDNCNRFFGSTYEGEYSNFLMNYHCFGKVKGKKSIPKYQSRDQKMYATWFDTDMNRKILALVERNDSKEVDISELCKAVNINFDVDTYTPVRVFKNFVKMAISIMPEEYLCDFQETIDWLLDKSNNNFYKDGKKLLLKYKVLGRFDAFKYPEVKLYKRKDRASYYDCHDPYMIFFLSYGFTSFIIEVPTLKKDIKYDISNIKFPYFYLKSLDEVVYDLSCADKVKTDKRKLAVEFGNSKEITEFAQDKDNLDIQNKYIKLSGLKNI